jgi:hypothetical protein
LRQVAASANPSSRNAGTHPRRRDAGGAARRNGRAVGRFACYLNRPEATAAASRAGYSIAGNLAGQVAKGCLPSRESHGDLRRPRQPSAGGRRGPAGSPCRRKMRCRRRAESFLKDASPIAASACSRRFRVAGEDLRLKVRTG